ncbi:CDC91 cell division cycle 91-like protein [Protomyces lactucae-debilis]|uniref:CDC91 cell division cycle 91-like protein n=1 Tax=Protomyces lactucae-debilis TaxID=2754530 RepID=A0A1Y2FSR6_PROLT|nr:CDC91 cell division cycle 91-like protein [Protomyces lactucae-debilis]ORY87040.1 CDC91 cell division cycle 91-like protein [Protomyces lactucae-debilis]
MLLAVVLRFCLLQWTALPGLLADRVEISAPVASSKRLNEGLFLHANGINPYDGGVFNQAPILLAMLSLFRQLPAARLMENLFYSISDVLTSWMVLQLASSNYIKQQTPPDLQVSQQAISIISALNPFSILVCVAKSSALFSSLAVMAALTQIVEGQVGSGAFLLAVATHLSLYPCLLLPPLFLLVKDLSSRKSSPWKFLTVFVGSLMTILIFSFLYTGSWRFLTASMSMLFLFTDLTPNVGLWWYFFTEIFEDFRRFFLGVFQLHLVIYVAPMCIKLRRDPLFAAVTLSGIIAIFKPYPSIADSAFYMTLLPLFPQIYKHTRNLFVIAVALLYCCIFGPAFHYLWIYQGSGNANFFYAITLVWNLSQGLLLTDIVFAWLREEWEQLNPQHRGKQCEITQVAD